MTKQQEGVINKLKDKRNEINTILCKESILNIFPNYELRKELDKIEYNMTKQINKCINLINENKKENS